MSDHDFRASKFKCLFQARDRMLVVLNRQQNADTSFSLYLLNDVIDHIRF